MCGDFTWRQSDCEELVGAVTEGDGVVVHHLRKHQGTKVAQFSNF